MRHFVYLNCAYQPEGRKTGLSKDQEDALLNLIHDFSQSDFEQANFEAYREYIAGLTDAERNKTFEDYVAKQCRKAMERGIWIGRKESRK